MDILFGGVGGGGDNILKYIAFCGGKKQRMCSLFKKNVYLSTKYTKYSLGWQQYLCPIYRKVLSKRRNVLKKISGHSKYWQHSN
jgi:hypothetical protein